MNGADSVQLDHLSRAERELVEDTLRVVSLNFFLRGGCHGVAAYFDSHGTRHYEPIIYDQPRSVVPAEGAL